jgi:hypothetical protein
MLHERQRIRIGPDIVQHPVDERGVRGRSKEHQDIASLRQTGLVNDSNQAAVAAQEHRLDVGPLFVKIALPRYRLKTWNL